MKNIIFIYRDPKSYRHFSDFIPRLQSLYNIEAITICMVTCKDDEAGDKAEEIYNRKEQGSLEAEAILVVTEDIKIPNMEQQYHSITFVDGEDLETSFLEKIKNA